MNPLVSVAIQNLPGIIALLKAQFGAANPQAPTPTDVEVIAAYQAALAESLAKDAQWLRDHPSTPSGTSSLNVG